MSNVLPNDTPRTLFRTSKVSLTPNPPINPRKTEHPPGSEPHARGRYPNPTQIIQNPHRRRHPAPPEHRTGRCSTTSTVIGTGGGHAID